MLLGQHGGGHQHRHLLAIHHRLEGGAQGHLGLAVAHIAADQAVHRARAFHIALDFVQHAQLVFGLDIGEAGFQLLLPGGIRAERYALRPCCAGRTARAVFGHFLHGFFDLRLGVAAIPCLPRRLSGGVRLSGPM